MGGQGLINNPSAYLYTHCFPSAGGAVPCRHEGHTQAGGCLSCALKAPSEPRELFLAQNPESSCDVDFGNGEHIQAFPETATLCLGSVAPSLSPPCWEL